MMRFAAASRFSAGDYATAASAGANALASTFDAARKSAPDWTTLARTSMNARSTERQAAMKAEADVATAGMKAFGNVKDMQIKGAYALEARKTEIDSRKRMAGRLGALGGFKLPKKSKSEYYNKRINQLDAMKDSPGSAEVGGPAPLPTAASQESVLKEFADQGPKAPQQPPTNPSSPSTNIQPISTNGSGGMDLSSLSDEDKKFIAYTVSGEAARGTDDIYGVAGVVLNRMRSEKWPSTAKGVAFQPGQFEAVEIGTARHEPELVNKLFSQEGMAKIQSAMQTLDGRDSFKGQTMLKHRVAAEDPMFHQRGNFYHHAWQG